MKTIKRAVDVFTNHPDAWKGLVQTAMKADFSWGKSAEKYMDLYYMAMGKQKAGVKSA